MNSRARIPLAAVRIVQEALTNTLVHAGAARARVELVLLADALRVDIHDDGSATSPPTSPIRLLASRSPLQSGQSAQSLSSLNETALPLSASALGGNGLIGMRERAVSCGGTLSIGTSPLGGWLVSAILPVSLGAAGITGPRLDEVI